MAKGEILCSWCQEPITSNPMWVVSRVTKGFLMFKNQQAFSFHNKGEMLSWILHGKKQKQLGSGE